MNGAAGLVHAVAALVLVLVLVRTLLKPSALPEIKAARAV